MKYRLTVTFLAVILAAAAQGADWPQWQGPDRNAISKEKGLLQEWPTDGPPLAWRIKGLGGGDSAPSVADGRLYGMSNRDGKEIVWALSEADGSDVWVTTLGDAVEQRMPQSKEGPGCTPTVDGERLYVIGMGGKLACLSVPDGKIIWQRSFTEDFGGTVPRWSYRESPLVDGDKLICTPGAPDAMMVALDKTTGNTIWKSALPAAGDGDEGGRGRDTSGRGRGGFGRGGFGRGPALGAAYASAIAIDFDGKRQYVQLTATTLVGVAAMDGKVLWSYERPANNFGINCTTPVHQDGKLFASSAYGAGGGLVKLTTDADGGVTAEEVYHVREMQNHHGGMIVFDGCLYGANGGNGGGFLTCIDFATGNVLWQDRDARKGSLAFADGRLYLRTEDGEMILIEPNREKFVERGRFDQPDRSESHAWAHPVIANGRLYVRDQDLLLCYDVKAEQR